MMSTGASGPPIGQLYANRITSLKPACRAASKSASRRSRKACEMGVDRNAAMWYRTSATDMPCALYGLRSATVKGAVQSVKVYFAGSGSQNPQVTCGGHGGLNEGAKPRSGLAKFSSLAK